MTAVPGWGGAAPVMATGVPKPAVPSKNEPTANAISTSWIDRSSLSVAKLCFMRSNAPCSAVS